MSKIGKPEFWKLNDGQPANKFDARQVLARRREKRRESIPFTPVLVFGLVIDEGRNDGGPNSMGAGAADGTGVPISNSGT